MQWRISEGKNGHGSEEVKKGFTEELIPDLGPEEGVVCYSSGPNSSLSL